MTSLKHRRPNRANGVPSFSCSQVFHTWEAAHPPRSAPDPWPWHHVCGVTCRFQVGQPLHRGCADAWLGFTSRTLIRPRSIRGNSRSRHRGAMMFLDRFQSPVRTCSWTRGVPGFTSGQQLNWNCCFVTFVLFHWLNDWSNTEVTTLWVWNRFLKDPFEIVNYSKYKKKIDIKSTNLHSLQLDRLNKKLKEQRIIVKQKLLLLQRGWFWLFLGKNDCFVLDF